MKNSSFNYFGTIVYERYEYEIWANSQRIKQDLMEQAKNRSLVTTKTLKKLENFQIFFDEDSPIRYAEFILVNKIPRLRYFKLIKIVSLFMRLLFTRGEKIAFAFSVSSITLVQIQPFDQFINLDELLLPPAELAKQFVNGFQDTWKHEREHILRSLDPVAKREDRINAVVQLFVLECVVLGTFFNVSVFSNLIFHTLLRINNNWAFVWVIIGLFACFKTFSFVVTEWYYHYSATEEAARNAAINGNSLKELFKIKVRRAAKKVKKDRGIQPLDDEVAIDWIQNIRRIRRTLILKPLK